MSATHRPAAVRIALSARDACGALLLVLLLGGCQPSPEELWQKAQAAQREGDEATAAIHLKNLLMKQPDNAAARAALGSASLALGDPASAEKELRRAVALGGDAAASRLALAEAVLAQGRYEESLKELGPVDEASAPSARALMLAGRANEGLGKPADAEALYRRAAVAGPSDPQPLMAMAALALASDRADEADALVDRALLLDPNYVPAMVLKGRRVFEARGAADAETYFREALGRAKTPIEEGEMLVNLAEVQLLRDDVKGASESVTRLEAVAPREIPTRYLRARVQAQSGDYAEAILGLQQIMNDAPGFRPAERLLGTVHYLNGNLEQAAMHISRVIEGGAADPFLSRLLAELRLQQDRPEQALQTLLPMIRQSPGAAFEQGLLALAGQASLRLGDSEAALSYFKKGAESYPDNERFRLGEISARLASGDSATARTMLESMRSSSSNPLAVDYLSVMAYLVDGDNAKAEELATRLARENAGEAWSHLLLASVYALVNKNVEARREFEAVVKIEPRNQEALINLARLDYQQGDKRAGENRLLRLIEEHPEDYRPRLLLAEAQLSEGRVNEALEQGRRAVRLAPDAAVTLNLVGRAAAAAGRWDEARDSFSRITTLDPDSPRVWLNLARATVAAGQNTSLPESLKKAMTLAPRDPAVLVTAGDLSMEIGQPAAAVKYYEDAYTLAPGSDVAIRACRARLTVKRDDRCALVATWLAKNPSDVMARLFTASLHQTRGEAAAAIAAYEAVLVNEPRQPVALNNLAWLYFESSDTRAVATAERALQAQPDSAAVMDTVGWIQSHRGDKRRGLELVTSAAGAQPDDPEIQYHLAYVLAESGELAGARRAVAAALAARPSFPSRAEAEQLKRRLESGGAAPAARPGARSAEDPGMNRGGTTGMSPEVSKSLSGGVTKGVGT